jgi:hypothetical protein
MKLLFRSILCASAIISLTASTLSAATFVVSNTSDSGSGSLRQAMLNANAGGGGDIIFSNVTGVISLASSLPNISASVNILGPGTNLLIISGDNQYSIFGANAGTTNTFANFTIADGYTESQWVSGGMGIVVADFPGCAISNSGTMNVLNCVISNCIVDGSGDRVGGAVFNAGSLAMENCLFVACGSDGYNSGITGGGIFNSGHLSMTNCCLTNCTASDAPGIYNSGTALLNNCLLTDLMPDDGEGNGGAFMTDGSLTLISCVISNCSGGWEGGAIDGSGIVASNTVFVQDGAGFEGGGFYISGSNFFYGCTISGCGAGAYGGGGFKNFGNTTFVNCTISGNSAIECQGGGIYNLGTVRMTNCTVSGNSCTPFAGDGGGGILNISNAMLYLTDCTIVSNTSGVGPGGGIENDAGGVTYVKDSIVANNASNDFTGALNSGGHNLLKNTNGCVLTGTLTGNLYGIDPQLGPLQNNGGLTMTHALLASSPAIDAGPADDAPFFDQRGITRPQGAADDIGAYEYGSVPRPALVAVAPGSDGCFHVNFSGVPGFSYTLLRAPTPAGPWTTLSAVTACSDGSVACTDAAPPVGSAFYRAVSPPH